MPPVKREVPWSIVLAGGEGNRLRPFTERWLGRHVPKQYCAFSGRQTMLEDALDRAVRLSGACRTVTVVAREHVSLSDTIFSAGGHGHRIVQPRNCDTAAGIYLPLTYVRKCDPEAVVVVLPSDHFLRSERRFIEIIKTAVRAALDLGDQLVLVGAVPHSPEPDYGWVIRGHEIANFDRRPVHVVQAFIEKPDEAMAANLMAAGALWNTFIMAARVETLWDLGWTHVSELMPLFERLGEMIGTPGERETLDAIYGLMPEKNFSSAILQNARGHASVIELDGVAWSDWGRPDRIANTIARFDLTAAFPMAAVPSPSPARQMEASTCSSSSRPESPGSCLVGGTPHSRFPRLKGLP